ncbi:MAG TPA: 4-alpha-glucanotransferase [Elusimicrobia bacterium]|nr:4-alpha-glucanotransferase [Elusimicrobiota bacterium]HBT61419.1 4-alpha-glucanotransferase [Elusimicrobiota bacterium]
MKLGIRSSGVLLHPTSLPGPHGIGDIGYPAHKLAEALAACSQSWWQMLPIVPPGGCRSPYNAISAFAGNPLLLNLDVLIEEGYLGKDDVRAMNVPEDIVDFASAERFKLPLLLKAYESFSSRASSAARASLEAFRERNADWLEDYALFCALRQTHDGAAWTQWDEELRLRQPKALAGARRSLDSRVRFHYFLQHQFSLQWTALRKRCGELGVGLIGDVPIFVAHDSADVWANQKLFWIDQNGKPLKVAGVPPDYFSKTGQFWGNPLYRWEAMRKCGYDWWIARFRCALERFDAVRLDHFIGFHNYWEIPGGAPTAEHGQWVPGPGADLFTKVRNALGHVQIIAEDLGVVTPEVKALRDRFDIPGLKVLQMAFGTDPEADNYKPHNYPRNCVVYTGTHDNDTTMGWFSDQGTLSSTRSRDDIRREREAILRYVGTDGREIHWDMIRLAFMSVADIAIIPAQDLLGLGSSARMNLPGSGTGNWRWRMKAGALNEKIVDQLSVLTETYGRRPAR